MNKRDVAWFAAGLGLAVAVSAVIAVIRQVRTLDEALDDDLPAVEPAEPTRDEEEPAVSAPA
jgi:hypothetical protein